METGAREATPAVAVKVVLSVAWVVAQVRVAALMVASVVAVMAMAEAVVAKGAMVGAVLATVVVGGVRATVVAVAVTVTVEEVEENVVADCPHRRRPEGLETAGAGAGSLWVAGDLERVAAGAAPTATVLERVADDNDGSSGGVVSPPA